MNRSSRVSITLLALLGSASAVAAAEADPAAQIRASDQEQLVMTLHAKGVQVYECRNVKPAGAYEPAAYEWAFVAPDAELYDGQGRKAGRHYAGPQWEAPDGSRVAGSVKARAEAPAAGAIPWLLLTAKSVGPDGTMSKVSSVQRINTQGGATPSAGCSAEAVGKQARVDYSADYVFLAPR